MAVASSGAAVVGLGEAIGVGMNVAIAGGAIGVRVSNGSAVSARCAPIGCEAAGGAPQALIVVRSNNRPMVNFPMRDIILHLKLADRSICYN